MIYVHVYVNCVLEEMSLKTIEIRDNLLGGLTGCRYSVGYFSEILVSIIVIDKTACLFVPCRYTK